jgi:hypothetical protein
MSTLHCALPCAFCGAQVLVPHLQQMHGGGDGARQSSPRAHCVVQNQKRGGWSLTTIHAFKWFGSANEAKYLTQFTSLSSTATAMFNLRKKKVFKHKTTNCNQISREHRIRVMHLYDSRTSTRLDLEMDIGMSYRVRF